MKGLMMQRQDWLSYSRFLLVAYGVVLAAATVQQHYMMEDWSWRFYAVPVLIATLFGVLLGRIAVLGARLNQQYRRQAALVDEHAWEADLQQHVVEQLNHHAPLPEILNGLLTGLSERCPELVVVLAPYGQGCSWRAAASGQMAEPVQQVFLNLASAGEEALLAAAEQNLPLEGQVVALEQVMAAHGLGSGWCLEIGEGEQRVGLMLLARRDGQALSLDEFVLGKAVVQLALLAITQQQHEEAVQCSNDQLTALLEAIPDAIFFKDGEGRWLYINDAATALFSLSGVPWRGKSDGELALLHPSHREAFLACIEDDERAWQGGGLGIFEERVEHPDGRVQFFEVRKKPLFEHDGGRKALVVIGRDVTEQVERESELRIAAITFESQEGMLVADGDGRILRANHALLRQTGYHAEEVIGKRVGVFKSGHHDAAFYEAMWASLRKAGFWHGEVWNRRKNDELYPVWLSITAVHDRHAAISHFVATYSDVSERKEAEKQIRSLAFYDPLTSLPNRRLLQDRLQQALVASQRSGLHGALLFIDLDNFKTLNDTQGHLAGDMLLTEVAQRLGECVREIDTVARLGGDEFVVLLEELSPDAEHSALLAEQVGEKLFSAINRPFLLRDKEHYSTPSIGVCLFHGTRESGEELLMRADMAMYQAKADGRNTIRFFDPSMQQAVEAKAMLEGELRQALVQGGLLLNYQIQMNEDGSVHGAEALVRWIHPVHGMISPADFIPVAEETALILPVGQWVLNEACRLLHSWSDTPLSGVCVAVNISARQFRQLDFVEQVEQTLQQHQVEPQRLKLELTESLVLDNIEDTICKMHRLRALGCRFSMDDFGTGYSSLAYLRRLPLDELKIDQSFVRDIAVDPNDDAIVRAIIALASTLGLNIVAEGVETEQQRELLQRHGCSTYQGYLFGRPLSEQEFTRHLSDAP